MADKIVNLHTLWLCRLLWSVWTTRAPQYLSRSSLKGRILQIKFALLTCSAGQNEWNSIPSVVLYSYNSLCKSGHVSIDKKSIFGRACRELFDVNLIIMMIIFTIFSLILPQNDILRADLADCLHHFHLGIGVDEVNTSTIPTFSSLTSSAQRLAGCSIATSDRICRRWFDIISLKNIYFHSDINKTDKSSPDDIILTGACRTCCHVRLLFVHNCHRFNAISVPGCIEQRISKSGRRIAFWLRVRTCTHRRIRKVGTMSLHK